jgi:Skp family chaperone for outer membrane proteins
MKDIVKYCGCAMLLWAGLSVSSAGELKVAVADRMQILAGHRQLTQAMQRLNADDAAQKAEYQKATDNLDALRQDFQRLTTESRNVTASDSDRTRAGSAAEIREGEIRLGEAALKKFNEEHRRKMAARLQEMRQKYFAEIQAAVKAYAAEQQLALVLDSSALAAQSGVGGVLHADAQLDITAAIIDRVNQPRPPAAATSAPAGQRK